MLAHESAPVRPEELLAHAGWLRQLALGLVGIETGQVRLALKLLGLGDLGRDSAAELIQPLALV